MDDAEWAGISAWGVHRRLNYNFHRLLSIDLGSAPGLCICEDDLEFVPGFVSTLLATIDEIEQSLDKYILAVYSPYDLEDPAYARGRLYCAYAAPFYANQCIYYPRSIIPEVAEFILANGVHTYTEPNDLLVKRIGEARRCLYATRRSLVQHIGSVSTGVGDGLHRSPSFARQGPLLPTMWDSKGRLGKPSRRSRSGRAACWGEPVPDAGAGEGMTRGWKCSSPSDSAIARVEQELTPGADSDRDPGRDYVIPAWGTGSQSVVNSGRPEHEPTPGPSGAGDAASSKTPRAAPPRILAALRVRKALFNVARGRDET